jgi:hypothetical protein
VSRKRKRKRINEVRRQIADKDALSMEQVLLSMEQVIECWELDLDAAEESLETTTNELEDARLALAEPPEWGNCRRGCAPAYLDRAGFCSPACKLGAPRGEFVTIIATIATAAE